MPTAYRTGEEWRIADESIQLKAGEMLVVCCVCGEVKGIKSGATSGFEISHGLCDKCMEKELSKINRRP